LTDIVKLPTGHLAWRPDILRYLEDVVHRQGFAGPASIPQIVYLTHITSMLTRPVSLVIKGPSGSGKSFCLQMGEQFIPPSAYERVEGMSEKALLYATDLNLKNRHLVIGEAAGMAEGSGRVFLRQVLSEGKVRYLTVEKTDSGQMKASEKNSLEGPLGLIMTTTAHALHPEDESRMLSVTVQDSAEQIAAALLAQALGSTIEAYVPDTTEWFELFECIKSNTKRVDIPFATALARRLPTTHDRIKRDFPQILALIKACALVHQHTRSRNESGAVVATLDDYAAVKGLLGDALAHNLSVAVSAGVRSVVEGVKALQKRSFGGHFEPVTVHDLAAHLERDRSVITRHIERAVEEGFLVDDNPGKGRQSQLSLGKREIPDKSALPERSELEQG
jgi:hypothetical protein